MMVDPRDPHDPEELADEDRGDKDGKAAEVSPIVVDAISKALQSHYQAIAEMPLPDRFLVLLAELEARERRHEK